MWQGDGLATLSSSFPLNIADFGEPCCTLDSWDRKNIYIHTLTKGKELAGCYSDYQFNFLSEIDSESNTMREFSLLVIPKGFIFGPKPAAENQADCVIYRE